MNWSLSSGRPEHEYNRRTGDKSRNLNIEIIKLMSQVTHGLKFMDPKSKHQIL